MHHLTRRTNPSVSDCDDARILHVHCACHNPQRLLAYKSSLAPGCRSPTPPFCVRQYLAGRKLRWPKGSLRRRRRAASSRPTTRACSPGRRPGFAEGLLRLRRSARRQAPFYVGRPRLVARSSRRNMALLLMDAQYPSGAKGKSPAARLYTPAHQQEKQMRNPLRDTASKSSMKLTHLLKMTTAALVRSLNKSGHLIPLRKCKYCKSGSLQRLSLRGDKKAPVQRCRRRDCQNFNLVHYGHPIFAAGTGRSRLILQVQSALLLCATWGHPPGTVPTLIPGVGKKCVERVYRAWRACVATYMEDKQKGVIFGESMRGRKRKLDEIEVGESVFRKRSASSDHVQWTGYVGLKRRGDRRSLILVKRPASNSISTRAQELRGRAVPPPTTRAEWLHDVHVREGTLVHTDGAQAYKKTRPGVYHDHVSHSTTATRSRPEFTKMKTRVLWAVGGRCGRDSEHRRVVGSCEARLQGCECGGRRPDERSRPHCPVAALGGRQGSVARQRHGGQVAPEE